MYKMSPSSSSLLKQFKDNGNDFEQLPEEELGWKIGSIWEGFKSGLVFFGSGALANILFLTLSVLVAVWFRSLISTMMLGVPLNVDFFFVTRCIVTSFMLIAGSAIFSDSYKKCYSNTHSHWKAFKFALLSPIYTFIHWYDFTVLGYKLGDQVGAEKLMLLYHNFEHECRNDGWKRLRPRDVQVGLAKLVNAERGVEVKSTPVGIVRDLSDFPPLQTEEKSAVELVSCSGRVLDSSSSSSSPSSLSLSSPPASNSSSFWAPSSSSSSPDGTRTSAGTAEQPVEIEDSEDDENASLLRRRRPSSE